MFRCIFAVGSKFFYIPGGLFQVYVLFELEYSPFPLGLRLRIDENCFAAMFEVSLEFSICGVSRGDTDILRCSPEIST